MRNALVLLGSLIATSGLQGQKRAVDTSTFNRWSTVSDPAISNDGRYALYTKYERFSYDAPGTLVVQALNARWQIELSGVRRRSGRNAAFTENSRQMVYLTATDSLCLLTVERSSPDCIPGVASYQLFTWSKDEWLVYRSATSDRQLVVRNLASARRWSFPAVTEYLRSEDGSTLVLKTESGRDGEAKQTLSRVSVSDGSSTTIWEGRNAGSPVLDPPGDQLAFAVADTVDGRADVVLWYYRKGMTRAKELATNRSAGLDGGMQLDDVVGFSKDGRRLLITLRPARPETRPDAVLLSVWSYTDAKLQSQQRFELRMDPPNRLAKFNLPDGERIVRLQQETDGSSVAGLSDDYLLFPSSEGDESESYWNRTAQRSYHIVSAETGERRKLEMWSAELSPGGRYVVGMHAESYNLESYDIAAGTTRDLTSSLPIPLTDDESRQPAYARSRGLRLAAWLPGDEAVLVYDRYDIWQLDLAGRRPPINLTNGHGRRRNIVFRLAAHHGGMGGHEVAVLDARSRVILLAFDRMTKRSGFYRMALGRGGRDPELLTIGDYVWEKPLPRPVMPLKARDAEVYLVQRESASESPNYFWTRDFKRFSPVSHVYPERDYNWIISELINFRALDGTPAQGVLYKPEDFDPTKKYPVILNYYDNYDDPKSDERNLYRPPTGLDDNGGNVDVSFFASQGYLVFALDVHFTTGEPGESAYRSVVGAAQHLASLPWVDAQHIAINGHSFGGYETNYLVAHTGMFAAAVSSAGIANLVASYGDVWGVGVGFAEWVENRGGRMAATPWERPEAYIRNSPIFDAHRVTTPLLIVHNPKDVNARFHHGLAWFTALRRLGKRAWMLEYDEHGHGVHGKDAIDLTIRIKQFFDHYLRGACAPRWLTRGIPASMKGVDDGLELDCESGTPGPGLGK